MITVKAVRKIAREKGISISMISVFREEGNLYLEMAELPQEVIKRNLESGDNWNNTEVCRLIRKYNSQARKIVAALRNIGLEISGRLRGSGEWGYTTRRLKEAKI
jgi:hypothetical protein